MAALRAAGNRLALGATFAAKVAQEHRCRRAYDLHHLCYRQIREGTGLGANMAAIAIRRVAAAYQTLHSRGELKTDQPWPPLVFSGEGAMRLDARTFWVKGEMASVWSLAGRQVMPMQLGQRQRRMVAAGKVGGADLIRKRGKWFLHLMMNMPDAPRRAEGDVMGLDVGENTLAATSDGRIFGGEALRHLRDVHLAHRRRLQVNGSQSAMQRLRRASGREKRHVSHVNHEASRAIVDEATLQGCQILAMEDLTHIRARIKAGRRMRARLHRWAWRQLQTFVAYKAEGAGMGVVYVDPAYTSQTCASCLCLGTRRRHLFTCSCGSRRHADSNAASNIRRLGGAIAPSTRYVTAGHVALSPLGAA